jgi:uroporphyrinogen-III synthase
MYVKACSRDLPLHGLTIAITGSRRANELAHLVTSLGGKPYVAPTIAIQAPNKMKTVIHQFITEVLDRKIDLVLVMTGPGIQVILDESKRINREQKFLEALRQIPLITRSRKPQQVLLKHGISGNVTLPPHETVEACFELALGLNVSAKRVAVIWHGTSSAEQVKKLRTTGAQVLEFLTYQYSDEFDKNGTDLLESLGYKYVEPNIRKIFELIENLVKGNLDAVTFTSPPAVDNLFDIAAEHDRAEDLRQALNNVVTVAIGPTTKQTIEKHGVHVKVVPDAYKMGPMMTALVRYVEQSDLPFNHHELKRASPIESDPLK